MDAGASETTSSTSSSGSTSGGGGDSGNDANMPVASPVVDVAAGHQFACAARLDGSVVCWGWNKYGQTAQPIAGSDTCGDSICRKPTVVAGLTNVAHVAAGYDAVCAAKKDGTVWCWGANDLDVLGHPAAQDDNCVDKQCTSTPKQVNGVTDAAGVVVGLQSACAWTSGGNVLCWGSDVSGELGRGNHDDGTFGAGAATGFSTNGAKQLTVDSSGTGHYCALRADGTMSCWGRNSSSELGFFGGSSPLCNGGQERCEGTPLLVKDSADAAVSSVTSMVATDGAMCIIKASTTGFCWGYSGHSITGKQDAGGPTVPTARAAINGLGGLAGATTHACGIGPGKTVQCWGTDERGQLGVPPSAATDNCVDGPCTPTPVTVAGVLAEKVFAGRQSSFALTPDGKLLGWGANEYGGLGHAPLVGESSCTSPCSPTPVEVVLP